MTLFNLERQRVNETLHAAGGAVRMTDGIRLRVGGRIRTYAARSTLQLLMDRIDPAFTLGVLGQERARLLEALRTEGLLRANGAVAVPPLPLHVALVTSDRSAAQADAVDELRRSGIGFRVSFLDARTQGRDAARSVAAALRTAEALAADVVLLVRGGGAVTDLAAFDDEGVARTIAALGVPVITGIGHETDRSVADEVAHTAHKTPTAAAAAVVEVVRDSRRRVHDAAVAVATGASGHLGRAGQRLDRSARRCGMTATRDLDRATGVVLELDRRSRAAAQRRPGAAASRVDDLARRLGPAATRDVEVLSHRLDALAARARVHDPATALARGWSLTRRADGGLVREPGDVTVGDDLVTTVAGGTVRSTVTGAGTDPTAGTGPTGDTIEEDG